MERLCLDSNTEQDFLYMADTFSRGFGVHDFMSALGSMANVAANLNECAFRDPVVDFMGFCGS